MIIPIVSKEQGNTGSTGLYIIIYKLGYKQKVILVRYFIRDKGTKVDLELLVDAFGLAVCLRVKGSTYTTLNADIVQEVLLK